MDKEKIKNQLQVHAIDLLDLVDELKRKNSNDELIDILERISNLGSMAILNFSTLAEKEIESVLKTMVLSEELIDKKNNLDYMSSLKELVNSIESLFREKRILLDKSPEKIAA